MLWTPKQSWCVWSIIWPTLSNRTQQSLIESTKVILRPCFHWHLTIYFRRKCWQLNFTWLLSRSVVKSKWQMVDMMSDGLIALTFPNQRWVCFQRGSWWWRWGFIHFSRNRLLVRKSFIWVIFFFVILAFYRLFFQHVARIYLRY